MFSKAYIYKLIVRSSELAHLSTTDGQCPVKQSPCNCLLTSGRCHGAHIAVVTVKVLVSWDNVAKAKVWDHCAAALTQQGK